MLSSKVKVTLHSSKARRVIDFNTNPQQRATASRHVNEGARSVIRYARKMAEAELKDRSDERRRHPDVPRYVDSFVHLPGTIDTIGRMSAGFGNTHPAAHIIEKGSAPHPITANQGGENSGLLVFPFKPNSTHSQLGGPPGDWPTEFTDANRTAIYEVTHPGTPGFFFFRRASAKYRRRSRW